MTTPRPQPICFDWKAGESLNGLADRIAADLAERADWSPDDAGVWEPEFNEFEIDINVASLLSELDDSLPLRVEETCEIPRPRRMRVSPYCREPLPHPDSLMTVLLRMRCVNYTADRHNATASYVASVHHRNA